MKPVRYAANIDFELNKYEATALILAGLYIMSATEMTGTVSWYIGLVSFVFGAYTVLLMAFDKYKSNDQTK